MVTEIDYHITMVSKNNELVNLKGSSLTFSAQGGRGKEKKIAAAKISVRPRKNTAKGGCVGNSAVFLQKIEAGPAACSVRSRSQQKSFLFLLEEKIRRAQRENCREKFFAGWRALASGGGLASLVWFSSGISDKMSSSQIVKTHQNLTFSKLWCLHQESNLDHQLRRLVFYPLNYEGY